MRQGRLVVRHGDSMDNLPEEWEAILPSYGQIEMWDFTSHNNTLVDVLCAIYNTLDEGGCDTLHLRKGGVILSSTKH